MNPGFNKKKDDKIKAKDQNKLEDRTRSILLKIGLPLKHILITSQFWVPFQPIERSFLVPEVPLPHFQTFGCPSKMSFPWKEKTVKGQSAKVAWAFFS